MEANKIAFTEDEYFIVPEPDEQYTLIQQIIFIHSTISFFLISSLLYHIIMYFSGISENVR